MHRAESHNLVFAHQFVSDGTPPREWAERLYNISRWTEMPRGPHFAAMEEPELLARDIMTFFVTRYEEWVQLGISLLSKTGS